MAKQTRIGLIRDAIVAAGGNSKLVSYTDGPRSISRHGGDLVRIKIERWSDGLTAEQRQAVAYQLNARPDVHCAYISRPYSGGHNDFGGQHLIVFFKGKSESSKKAEATKKSPEYAAYALARQRHYYTR